MTDFATKLATEWVPTLQQDCAASGMLMLSPGTDVVYTGLLLVNKDHGWWTDGIEVVPVEGVFRDRDAASKAVQAAAEKLHRETGKKVSGSYTSHRLPDPDEPTPVVGPDGRGYQTHWAVFEDILATFPVDWNRRG